MREEIDFWD